MASAKSVKSPKSTKTVPVAKSKAKIHYDIFSKSRGYICSAPNEGEARNALSDLHAENERFWRAQISDGKKFKRCDVYCMCREGTREWELPFMFDDGDEDEEFNPEGDMNA